MRRLSNHSQASTPTKTFLAFLFISLILALSSCEKETAVENLEKEPAPAEFSDFLSEAEYAEYSNLKRTNRRPFVVVANRASGSISLIDAVSDQLTKTIKLGTVSSKAEPMYVVSQPSAPWFFVGDRANNQVLAFYKHNLRLKKAIPAGEGVFHMWSDYFSRQLWVVNDIDKTISVINGRSLQNIANFSIPQDLIEKGGKPHDVVVSPRGQLAYVSILGVDGASDFVVQYSTRSFKEIGRAAVGKDPHLSVRIYDRNLYVPCQNSNAVYVLDRGNMMLKKIIDVPGAHGAGMPFVGNYFYTTNISGGGSEGLYSINLNSLEVADKTDTPFAVPHNIATSPRGDKVYVSHSGPTANQLTVYKADTRTGETKFKNTVIIENNPFGLAYVW